MTWNCSSQKDQRTGERTSPKPGFFAVLWGNLPVWSFTQKNWNWRLFCSELERNPELGVLEDFQKLGTRAYNKSKEPPNASHSFDHTITLVSYLLNYPIHQFLVMVFNMIRLSENENRFCITINVIMDVTFLPCPLNQCQTEQNPPLHLPHFSPIWFTLIYHYLC